MSTFAGRRAERRCAYTLPEAYHVPRGHGTTERSTGAFPRSGRTGRMRTSRSSGRMPTPVPVKSVTVTTDRAVPPASGKIDGERFRFPLNQVATNSTAGADPLAEGDQFAEVRRQTSAASIPRLCMSDMVSSLFTSITVRHSGRSQLTYIFPARALCKKRLK